MDMDKVIIGIWITVAVFATMFLVIGWIMASISIWKRWFDH